MTLKNNFQNGGWGWARVSVDVIQTKRCLVLAHYRRSPPYIHCWHPFTRYVLPFSCNRIVLHDKRARIIGLFLRHVKARDDLFRSGSSVPRNSTCVLQLYSTSLQSLHALICSGLFIGWTGYDFVYFMDRGRGFFLLPVSLLKLWKTGYHWRWHLAINDTTRSLVIFYNILQTLPEVPGSGMFMSDTQYSFTKLVLVLNNFSPYLSVFPQDALFSRNSNSIVMT